MEVPKTWSGMQEGRAVHKGLSWNQNLTVDRILLTLTREISRQKWVGQPSVYYDALQNARPKIKQTKPPTKDQNLPELKPPERRKLFFP